VDETSWPLENGGLLPEAHAILLGRAKGFEAAKKKNENRKDSIRNGFDHAWTRVHLVNRIMQVDFSRRRAARYKFGPKR